MGPGKNEEMQKEFIFFGECWQFFKKYYHIGTADEEWEVCTKDAEMIVEKHQNQLCECIIQDILDELERRSLDEKK